MNRYLNLPKTGKVNTMNLSKQNKVKIMKKSYLQGDDKLTRSNLKLLNRLYSKGKAAYGSKANLVKASKLPASTVEAFLQNKPAHTKYKVFKSNFPRLKVLAFRINEIWSVDLVYVDKLSKHNNGTKYLLTYYRDISGLNH